MKGFGSKSIVSSLKIGMKEKAATQMREEGENPVMRESRDETGTLTIHQIKKELNTCGRGKKLKQRQRNQ